MNSCEFAKAHLSDFLDHNLHPAILQSVELHLEDCPDCRLVFEQVSFLNTRLKEVHRIKTSPDFDRRLRRRILDSGQESKPFISVRGFSFGFSGAAVIAAATFLIFNTFSTQTPATSHFSPAKSMVSGQQSSSPASVQMPVAVEKSDQQRLALKDSLKNRPVPVDQSKIKLAEQEK